ncbi:MAG: hypothetical protein KDN20_15660 [Verrucomicrobiae bacterium]|nr:hypothetical protein [Verrucomicrobiae bacterium]
MNETNTAQEMGYAIGGIFGCVLVIVIPVLFIVSLILAIVKKSKAWTIVCVISGLLGLGLIGTSIFFAAKGISAAAKAASESKILTGPDGQFHLDVPGNWSENNLGSEDASVQVGNLFREEYLLVIEEPKADFEAGFTVSDFAELASGMVEESLAVGNRGELTELTINGLPAARCRIKGSADGVQVVYLNTYVEGANHFYQVMAWTLPSKEKTAFPIFEKAVGTFREGDAEDEGAPAESEAPVEQ